MNKTYSVEIEEKVAFGGLKYFRFRIFGKDNKTVFHSMNAHADVDSAAFDAVDKLREIDKYNSNTSKEERHGKHNQERKLQ